MSRLPIEIIVEDAKPEEIARGLAVAMAYFDISGVTPWQAAEGSFVRDGWDDRGFHKEGEPTDAQWKAADVWGGANRLAAVAISADWPKPLDHVILNLCARVTQDEPAS